MHRIVFILLLGFTSLVVAQSDQPEDLLPLPELSEPPPLPPDVEMDPELEPEITIIQRGEDTIEEHRINGELYMIKVIPRIGFPYYLVRFRRGGEFSHPGDVGSDVSAPMWRILEF